MSSTEIDYLASKSMVIICVYSYVKFIHREEYFRLDK
jgi:hypothetical protein